MTSGIFHGIARESVARLVCTMPQKIRSLNFVGNNQDGQVGFDIVEYTTAFLHTDWLYSLWHGIKNCKPQYKSNNRKLTLDTISPAQQNSVFINSRYRPRPSEKGLLL